MALRPVYSVKFHLILIAAVLLIPVTLGSSATIFNDGDVSWHVATGQWILSHGAIPRVDPFSFSAAGTPWVPIEWLAEVLLASAYGLAGYSGISALVTAALMALHATIFFNAVRFIRPTAALAAIVAMDIVLIPSMLARPHLFAWALLAGWTLLMLRAREENRAPPLAAALIMTVWANLHGSFVLGLFVSAAFALEAVLVSQDRPRVLRQWGVFGFGATIAVFINANGVDGVLHPLHIAGLSTLPLIDEWKPSNLEVTPFFFALLAAGVALLLLQRPRMHPVRWLLLGVLLALALFQMRQQAVLAIVTAIILPPAFAQKTEGDQVSRPVWWATAAAAMALIAIRLVMPITPEDNEANPRQLIAAVPPKLRSQPVLNGYVMGGPLILSGIKPYIDGRGDVYGDKTIGDYKRITDGDAAKLNEAVRKWDIRWAILPHRYARLVALLDRNGWRKIGEDRTGAIYVRD